MQTDSPVLWIFNPDTDYALASNRRYYTPPASVITLRRNLALTFLPIAKRGQDAILLLDNISHPEIELLSNYREAICNGIEIVTIEQLRNNPEKWCSFIPKPWGWNKSLLYLLKESVGTMPDLPTEFDIDNVRRLSHRRTSIEMLNFLQPITKDEITIPFETSDISRIVTEFNKNHNLYLKAPWSSSGRGILFGGDLELKHVEPWARGIIRKQGSLIIEKAYIRNLDFASEWYIENGEVEFIGYSVFNVSNRGKYHGNLLLNQKEIIKLIETKCYWDPYIIKHQKNAIKSIIAPSYSGPLGIDMLATASGAINPCVEINLRYTMGHIAIYQELNNNIGKFHI
ncbi:MAG: hypothetical protein K2M87_01005 [Muribaculaceae bacterium]|nr:hypothetical protein [Muribaculaceae bacterium]